VPELADIRVDGATIVIGAATTFARLELDPVARLVPALAYAARTVGSPQIRNAATIGGNLATASPAGDALPVLVALGASVEVAGRHGRRLIPIAEFFTGPKRSVLEVGDLVVAVRVPVRRGPQEYLKVGVRNAMVIAVASLAIVVDLDGSASVSASGPSARRHSTRPKRVRGSRPGRVGEAMASRSPMTTWSNSASGWPARCGRSTITRTAQYRRHAVV